MQRLQGRNIKVSQVFLRNNEHLLIVSNYYALTVVQDTMHALAFQLTETQSLNTGIAGTSLALSKELTLLYTSICYSHLSFICLLIFCNIEFVLTMLGLCCKMEVARTSGLQSSISYWPLVDLCRILVGGSLLVPCSLPGPPVVSVFPIPSNLCCDETKTKEHTLASHSDVLASANMAPMPPPLASDNWTRMATFPGIWNS